MRGLKQPEEYLPILADLRERNRYGKDWVMRLEKKTNRHHETNGGPWGWYEIFPFSLTVGYWGTHRDDLRDVDIDAWNKKSEEISR